jgi:hypothetical protein
LTLPVEAASTVNREHCELVGSKKTRHEKRHNPLQQNGVFIPKKKVVVNKKTI